MKRFNVASSRTLESTIHALNDLDAVAFFRVEQRLGIFPIAEPYGRHEKQHLALATTSKSIARELLSQYPHTAIGVVCRRDSTIVKVVLVGQTGLRSWQKLAAIHSYFHKTRSMSNSNKKYLYFQCRGKSYSKDPAPFDNMFPGILICAEGSYVVDDLDYPITCDPILQRNSIG